MEMLKTLARIHLAREAGSVKRYHTARVIQSETVAEHSFNVANLILLLTGGTCSQQLIVAALTHDMGEYHTGDIPAPTKRVMPKDVQHKIEKMEYVAVERIHPTLCIELTTDEQQLLTLCDRLDGLLKCIDEVRMGNTHVIPIGKQYCHYLKEIMSVRCFYKTETQKVIDEFMGLIGNEN